MRSYTAQQHEHKSTTRWRRRNICSRSVGGGVGSNGIYLGPRERAQIIYYYVDIYSENGSQIIIAIIQSTTEHWTHSWAGSFLASAVYHQNSAENMHLIIHFQENYLIIREYSLMSFYEWLWGIINLFTRPMANVDGLTISVPFTIHRRIHWVTDYRRNGAYFPYWQRIYRSQFTTLHWTPSQSHQVILFPSRVHKLREKIVDRMFFRASKMVGQLPNRQQRN